MFGRYLLVAGITLSAHAQAQAPTIDSGRPLAAVIDEYVREGLRSNLSLRAQSLEVERSVAALDEARARYFPEVGFAARYTRAEGGRTIVPLSQPTSACQTLNDIGSAGQQPKFPVAGRDHRLHAQREQDTRHLRMPLVQLAIPPRCGRSASC
jgi:outer membrane protein TolC